MSNINGTRWVKSYTKCKVFSNNDVNDCTSAIVETLDFRFLPSNKDKFMKKYNIDD